MGSVSIDEMREDKQRLENDIENSLRCFISKYPGFKLDVDVSFHNVMACGIIVATGVDVDIDVSI